MVLVHGIHKKPTEDVASRPDARQTPNEGGDMTRAKDELQVFFEELGEWDEVVALARKKMIVDDLRAAMRARKVTPTEMAKRMRTRRQAVYRCLSNRSGFNSLRLVATGC
jgi:hypothetical protein